MSPSPDAYIHATNGIFTKRPLAGAAPLANKAAGRAISFIPTENPQTGTSLAERSEFELSVPVSKLADGSFLDMFAIVARSLSLTQTLDDLNRIERILLIHWCLVYPDAQPT
jgi:hypothetical protein